MELKNKFLLNFGKDTKKYLDILLEEDFSFKTKDIKLKISENKNSKIEVNILAKSFIDLKIANSAFMNTIEIITKTNKIEFEN